MGKQMHVHQILAICVVLIQISQHASAGESWSHSNVENWLHTYPECSGKQQSPINIDTKTLEYNPTLNPFKLTGFDSTDGIRGHLINNGHTAQVNLDGFIFVEAGGLAGTYKTAQVHFHWGGHDDQGSEHTVDEKYYPMEMHFVNYAIKYGNISAAATKKDGLAVLGCLLRISPNDNPYFDDIVKNLAKVEDAGSAAVNIDLRFPLRTLLPSDLTQYYRYSGSLTTPGCYETVEWTVFHETVTISPTQLREFRKLLAPSSALVVPGTVTPTTGLGMNDTLEYVSDNFRPVQSLNSRTVYTTQQLFVVDMKGAAKSLEQQLLWSILTVLVSSSSALHLL